LIIGPMLWIEAWFMAYGESNGHMNDDVTWPERLSGPNMLRAQHLKNSWRCSLATIANY